MNVAKGFLVTSVVIAGVTFIGAVVAGASMATRVRGQDQDSNNAQLLLDQALEKFEKGDSAGSRSLTDRVLAIVPAEPIARANLGRIYKLQGDYARAIAEHKLAITSDPELPDLYYNVACYYSLLKKKEDALHWLSLAFDHGFARIEHMRGDADLDFLESDPRFQLLARTGRLATGVPRVRFHPSTRRASVGDSFEVSLVVEREVPKSGQAEAIDSLEVEWQPAADMEVITHELATKAVEGDGFVMLRTTGRWVVKAMRAGFHVLPEARVTVTIDDKEVVVSSDTYGVDVEDAAAENEREVEEP